MPKDASPNGGATLERARRVLSSGYRGCRPNCLGAEAVDVGHGVMRPPHVRLRDPMGQATHFRLHGPHRSLGRNP
jgi:hypothetical protein